MSGLQRKPSASVVPAKRAGVSSRPLSRVDAAPARPATAAPRERQGEPAGPAPQERNIQVVVRCRALSWQEIQEKSDECILVDPIKSTEVTIAAPPPKTALPPIESASISTLTSQTQTKSYAFDHVFGPSADQGMVFNDVVAPLLEEVLQGYNCTCLCYGQTGTGKTHTMEGDLIPSLGTFSPQAGIIPRALHKLFDILNEHHSDFAVKVSFVELYNEELRDLNGLGEMTVPNGAHQPMAKTGAAVRGNSVAPQSKAAQPELKIYDDNAKRGVVIQGAEETNITNVTDGIRILTRGSQRRQAASTQVNEHSSRSHSIFTITVHLRQTSAVGARGESEGSEDHLRTGKLHLVDLAGSENVGRSGALAGRAREAGMINQSLLTLGRVINALVERNAHVPYRESKLTRILQDSLGGRTKTCIIATVSPAQINYDETLSTLDYALRARSIQNRPQANQRMTKAALLSQYAIEIERLKADLYATRTKTGVYISEESWSSMSERHEETRKEAEMQRRQAGAYQMQLASKTEEFEQCCRLLGMREGELQAILTHLDRSNADLAVRTAELVAARQSTADEAMIARAYNDKRKEWREWTRTAVNDAEGLRHKLARKHAVESANLEKTANAETAFGSATHAMREHLAHLAVEQQTFASALRHGLHLSVSEVHDLAATGSATSLENLTQQQVAQTHLVESARNLHEAGVTLAAATDAVRTDFIDDARERADAFRTICTDVVDALLEQHQMMLDTSFRSMQNVLEDVERGHALIVEQLQHNIIALQARKAAEEDRLKMDLQELETQYAALLESQTLQEQAASEFRSAFLVSVSAQVDEMLATQSSARVAAYESFKVAAFQSRSRAEANILRRLADDDGLLANEQTALGAVAQSGTSLERAAQAAKVDLEETAERGKNKIDLVGTTLSQEIDTSERAHALYEDLAALDAETYRKACHTGQADFTKSLEDLASATTFSFDKAASTLTRMCKAVEAAKTDTDALVSDHTRACEATVGLLSSQLSSLVFPTLETDIATGATPRQREWPTDFLEEELEGGREQLLARLQTQTLITDAPALPEIPLEIIPPLSVRLEIPLGAATAPKPVIHRSVLGEKLPNQAHAGKRALQDSINRP